jgi:calcium permeable stress-gated cation channel
MLLELSWAPFPKSKSTQQDLIISRLFTDSPHGRHRTPSSRPQGSHWFHDFRKIDDKFVLQHQSLDGYLFLRFFRIIIFICFAGCCITWPILFPINATGGGDASQLDKLTFGNVNQNDRLYAHAIVAWLFLGTFYHQLRLTC